MQSRFLLLYDAYGKVLKAIAIVAGAALFVVMWLVIANAVSRKFLNAPITGTSEIVEAAMPVVILLPMAFTQMRRGHVRVMLLMDRISPGVRRAVHVGALVIGCLLFAWIAWATWGYAARSLRIGENAPGILRFPLWPSKFSVSLGAELLALQFLLDATKVALIADDSPENFHRSPEDEAALHG